MEVAPSNFLNINVYDSSLTVGFKLAMGKLLMVISFLLLFHQIEMSFLRENMIQVSDKKV